VFEPQEPTVGETVEPTLGTGLKVGGVGGAGPGSLDRTMHVVRTVFCKSEVLNDAPAFDVNRNVVVCRSKVTLISW
jgi:hypothetical protein